ncbi:MAG: ABC-type transport auxiliary lipoprotein family protein [Rhodoferax sp.]|uniref:ABC-type transport auxiliary lipoprotein family protein n=1 Tax=Rhodoferax sp. TaxID=50421 RepID=UPI00260DD757|nr:ABC-type transport auxiliary lipoprotein family protein [Rhodoferax sp.]MDD2881037.1 ABC-type transport auxiliary lipoprotein family protein [Rhodoferax sp.]
MNGLRTNSSSQGGLRHGGPWLHGIPRLARHGGKAAGASLLGIIAMGVAALALSACSVLGPTATPATAFYALDRTQGATPAQPGTAVATPATVGTAATVTLLINPPHAAAGFDSSRIIYLREPHKLDYFAQSQWVDPPARMVGPLLVAAIEKTGAFRAVVLLPGAAAGEVRLDTDIVRLQHEFQTRPSQVRFTLRATLLEERTRRVLAWQEFEAVVPAISEDAYGGVLAANRAVQTVVDQLAVFVAAKAGAATTVPATP